VLSKEVALAAIPAFAVLVARQSPMSSRLFAVTGWLSLLLFSCSLYVLMALLKGEFFPAGTMLGGHHRHVSLLCSLEWQTSRRPFDASSAFSFVARGWAHTEPLLVVGGTAAAAVAVIVFRRRRVLSMVGWTVLSLWIFLGRGGVVLAFYLVPLLPLLALSIALVLDEATTFVRQRAPARLAGPAVACVVAAATAACGVFVIAGYERSDRGLWTRHPVDGQLDAARWVQDHLPAASRLVIDQYMWRDLHGAGRSPWFPVADYYWKVGDDPAIRRGVFHDDWRTVDYVVSTPQLIDDTRHNGFPVVSDALEHSVPIAVFDSGGWDVAVRRVDPHVSNRFRLPPVAYPRRPRRLGEMGARAARARFQQTP
jgi:hypothetical protein